MDFFDQPLAHGGQLFVGLAFAAAGNFLRVLGHQVFHGIGQGTGFDVVRHPIGLQHVGHLCGLCGGDGYQVKVAGKRRGGGIAVRRHFHKLQSAGDIAWSAATGRSCFAHAVVQHEQHARLGAVVVRVYKNGAAFEQAAVAGQHQVGHGGHEWVAWVHQVGGGLAVDGAVLAVEANALVLFQHGGAGVADHTVTLHDIGRHVAYLVAARLAVAQLATHHPECLAEECADEVRLELAGLGLVHFLADGVEVVQAHVVFDQGIAGHQVFQVLGVQRLADDLLHAGAGFGLFAVADGVDEQVFERNVVEGFTQHVEHPPTQGLAFHGQLFKQAVEHLALTGLGRHQIPKVAHLTLANAVDAAKALLHAVWVPGQVVVDHEVGVLQVHALARCVGGQQHQHVGVVAERLLHFAPVIAVDAAVDGDHSLFAAQRVADTQQQVVERVAVLGEHDDFAATAIGGAHFGLVLQQARKLFPLAVAARLHDGCCGTFQLPQEQDFGLQLRNGLGGSGLVHHLVGHSFVFLGAKFVGSVIKVFGQVQLSLDDVFTQVLSQHVGAGFELQLVKARFELFATARERCVNGLRAGCQAALQLGQGKAHGALALAIQPVRAVHFVADVVGDLVVQQHLGI